MVLENVSIKTKIYKTDDLSFNIVNYPYFDGVVPRATSCSVYISQLIRYARACSDIDDFNDRNKVMTSKLLGDDLTSYHFFTRNGFLSVSSHTQHFGLVPDGVEGRVTEWHFTHNIAQNKIDLNRANIKLCFISTYNSHLPIYCIKCI